MDNESEKLGVHDGHPDEGEIEYYLTLKFGRKQVFSGMVIYGMANRVEGKLGKLSTYLFVLKMGFQVPILLMVKSQSLNGIYLLPLADYRPHVVSRCLKEVVKLASEKKIDPVVDSVYEANDIEQAHARLEGRDSIGKVVVRWT